MRSKKHFRPNLISSRDSQSFPSEAKESSRDAGNACVAWAWSTSWCWIFSGFKSKDFMGGKVTTCDVCYCNCLNIAGIVYVLHWSAKKSCSRECVKHADGDGFAMWLLRRIFYCLANQPAPRPCISPYLSSFVWFSYVGHMCCCTLGFCSAYVCGSVAWSWKACWWSWVGTKRIKPRTSTFPSSLVKKMRLRLVFTFCGQGALRWHMLMNYLWLLIVLGMTFLFIWEPRLRVAWNQCGIGMFVVQEWWYIITGNYPGQIANKDLGQFFFQGRLHNSFGDDVGSWWESESEVGDSGGHVDVTQYEHRSLWHRRWPLLSPGRQKGETPKKNHRVLQWTKRV